MQILIAEDDEDIRNLLREILEGEGHTCDVASDGSDAKEILAAGKRFGLLISDFRMPNMDGMGLLSWCREQKIHLPVIFLSASKIFPDQKQIALSDCFAAFIRKPMNMDDLLEAIKAAA